MQKKHLFSKLNNSHSRFEKSFCWEVAVCLCLGIFLKFIYSDHVQKQPIKRFPRKSCSTMYFFHSSQTTYFISCSSVSIVNFELINAGWDIVKCELAISKTWNQRLTWCCKCVIFNPCSCLNCIRWVLLISSFPGSPNSVS